MGNCLMNKDCLFCKMLTGEEPRDLVYEDDLIFAFDDINKRGAREHILICPKTHIPNVNHLTIDHTDLIKHMKAKGEEILHKIDPNAEKRYGFHVPPLYSIDHLHLHVVMGPFKEWAGDKFFFSMIMRNVDEQIKICEKTPGQKAKL